MAMTVQHNAAAQLALGELNKNNNRLRKSLEKVSSGQKLNSAKDNASAYAISEKMREQIRTLLQDNQNIQNGSSLFKIADGGIQNIVDELRNLKELAINAANNTNTDSDRATIQKEFEQKMANINDIATTTAYNGKTLLDGTHSKDVSVVIPPSSTIIANSNATTFTQSLNTAKIIEKPTVINAGDFTITEDGIYSLAEDYTGTITINAQNVKLTQETPDTQLNNVSIVTRAEGSSNLWIENLNINNTEDKNIIKFQGADNYLTVKDTNTFIKSSSDYAAINVGDALTIIGDGTLNTQMVKYTHAAAIGSDRFGTSGDITIADNVTITATISGVSSPAAAIGSGYDGHIGNIKIGGNATVTATAGYGAAIGSGNRPSRVGDITIGGNANITASSSVGAAICKGGSVRWGGTSAGNITISSTANVVILHYGTYVSSGVTTGSAISTTFGSTISNGETSFAVNINEKVNTQQVEPGVTIISLVDFSKALKIHHGTKANQATNFFINDLHTKSLGTEKLLDDDGNILNNEDMARYAALSYDENLQNAWVETLESAQNKTLDDISVTTQRNANVAIRVLDGALEYAINEATQVGSYLQRLEYTAANVTTMGENVQSAESTIRDADMAKEMTDYTKNNVLLQAAQSIAFEYKFSRQ